MALRVEEEDAAFFAAALELLDELPSTPPDAGEGELDCLLGGCELPPVAAQNAEERGAKATNVAAASAMISTSDQKQPRRSRLVPLLPKPAACSGDFSPLPDTSQAKPRTRPRNYNPNKARDERKREIERLRLTIVDLQRQLRVINDQRATKPRRSGSAVLVGASRTHSSDDKGALAVPRVWEQLCRRQLQWRVQVESENLRLRQTLTAQLKLSQRMQRLLHKSATFDSPSLEALRASCNLQRATTIARGSAADAAIFDNLLVSADSAYRQVDAVFHEIGLFDCEVEHRDARVLQNDRGVCLDVYGNKVLPFGVRSTGAAVWNHYRGAEKHQGHLYSKFAEPAGDTVKEKFALELFANNTWADFQVWQVVRKFVDSADKVVVVWVSHVEPVEVSHKVLAGIGFQETGFAVCKRPQSAAETPHPDAFSLLQICYRMAPYTTDAFTAESELKSSSIRVLTAFAVSLASNNVRAHQEMIENVLIDLAVRQHQRHQHQEATA